MATEILMPKLGLTMTEGTVSVWDKQVGDAVQKGDILCTISSEKLSTDIEAPVDGYLIKVLVPEGEDAPVQAPLGYLGAKEETVQVAAKVASPEPVSDTDVTTPTPGENPPKTIGQKIFITPLAKKIAVAHELDYTTIQGSGGQGRITRRDVQRQLDANATATVQPSPTPITSSAAAGTNLTGMRKAIATHMLHSLQSTAQLTLQRKVDLTALMAFRSDLKQKVPEGLTHGQLSLTTLLARAVILALQQTPKMNAWYQDGQYTPVEAVHLGLAVGLEEGLIVPVVHNAQNMSLTRLGTALQDQITAARTNQLQSEDYSGGTFTITNLGHEAIEYFTPVLNTPEVGILGVGALTRQLSLSEDGKVLQSPHLPLSLTFDHQVIDGQQAAQFLEKIAQHLQAPYDLVL